MTTNQKIFSCEKGINFKDRVKEILSVIDAPLSIEVTKTNESDEAMIAEAKEYSSWSPKNIVIKFQCLVTGEDSYWLISFIKKKSKQTSPASSPPTKLFWRPYPAQHTQAYFIAVFGMQAATQSKSSKIPNAYIAESGLKTKIIVGSIRSLTTSPSGCSRSNIVTITQKCCCRCPLSKN